MVTIKVVFFGILVVLLTIILETFCATFLLWLTLPYFFKIVKHLPEVVTQFSSFSFMDLAIVVFIIRVIASLFHFNERKVKAND
jgi:hypothetical protein